MNEYSLIIGAVFFGVGLACSFFFSGTELGFYRISRIRTIMNALAGERRSRLLIWLANHPGTFISTVLVGNNLANYFVSMGGVMIFQVLLGDSGASLASIIITPLVFVYGELLPKSLFLQSPNRLMHGCAYLLWGVLVLLFPISILLTALNILLVRIVGKSPQHYALQMTEKELRTFFGEGRNAGILRKTQQNVADRIFSLVNQPIRKWAVPLDQFPSVDSSMTRDRMIRDARSAGANWILLRGSTLRPVGFYRFRDLVLLEEDAPIPVQEICEVSDTAPIAEVFAQLSSQKVPFALVTESSGKVRGLVVTNVLRNIVGMESCRL